MLQWDPRRLTQSGLYANRQHRKKLLVVIFAFFLMVSVSVRWNQVKPNVFK